MYTGKIFEHGDWLGKAISEIKTKDGLVITFIRYSYHHKAWSMEHLFEKTFKDLNLEQTDYFPEEEPSNICFCGWVN